MRLTTLVIAAVFIAALLTPAVESRAEEGVRLSRNREVSEVVPEPQVRVKFKKLADGSYTWEISGTNVRKLIEADSALRKYISDNTLKSK